MRNVVLIMTASLDGFVAAPEGKSVGGDSEPEPAELKRWKLERIRRAGTHIMGRVTYEGMAKAWPTSTDDYAAPMNGTALRSICTSRASVVSVRDDDDSLEVPEALPRVDPVIAGPLG